MTNNNYVWHTQKCQTCDRWVLAPTPDAVCKNCYGLNMDKVAKKLASAGFKVGRI